MKKCTSETIGSIPSCKTCGATNVVVDAWAAWNPEAGLFELENTFDYAHCHKCEGETKLVWSDVETPNTARIRELNELFRTEGNGNGTVLITSGLQEIGGEFVVKAIAAVRSFDAFSQDNDPWGEHDFGAIDLDGERIFFKIDPYNLDRTAGSDNPANAGLTHRVLTIMLASEY